MRIPAGAKRNRKIKKDFGEQYPQEEKSGWCMVLSLISACAVTAFFIFALAKLAPGAIDQMQDHSRQIVAESRGTAE